jgi:hypothetical protein
VIVENCRLSKHTYLAVACLVEEYAKVSGPVRQTDVASCMKKYLGKSHPEFARRGLYSAECLGYAKAIPSKPRSRRSGRLLYVPTLEGVVDAGIYLGLKDALGEDVVNKLPTDALPCYIRLVRIVVGVHTWTLAFTMQWLSKLMNIIHGVKPSPEDKAITVNLTFLRFIESKMLFGIEVRDLKPTYYGVILGEIIGHTKWTFEQPLPGLKPSTGFLIFLKPFMDKICNTT